MMNNKQIDVNNNVLFNYYNIPISQIDNFKYSFKNENNLKLDFSNLNMINKRLHNKLSRFTGNWYDRNISASNFNCFKFDCAW